MIILILRRKASSILAACAALAGLGPRPADAGAFTWSPTPSSNSWALPANWTGNLPPPTSGLAVSDITYNGSNATFPDLAPGYSVNSLTFNAAANGYSFSAGSLTLGVGGIVQNSTAAQTFAIPVSLGAASTWTLGAGSVGALTFTGGLALAGNNLTVTATGSGTIGGTISGTANLTKTGGGTLTLTGASTYTGSTVVNAGTLALSGGSSVSPLTVLTGGTWVIGAGGTLDGRANADFYNSFEGTLASPATVFVNDGTIYTHGDLVGVTGSAIINQSGGVYDLGSTFLTEFGRAEGSRGVYNLSGGTLTATAQVAIGSGGEGTLNQSGGTATFPGIIGSQATAKGTINLNGGLLKPLGLQGGAGTSVFNFNGGTLQARANSAAFLQGLTVANVRGGGAVIDTNGFDVTVAQSLFHSTIAGDPGVDGGLTKLGAGTLTLTGANTYTGATTIKAGTLSVANDSLLGGGKVVTILPGGALAFTSTGITTGRTYNLVLATLAPASGGTLTYASGAVVNGGTLGAGNHVLGSGVEFNGVRTANGAVLSHASGTVSFTNVTLVGTTTYAQSSGATLNSSGDFTAQPLTTLTIGGACFVTGGFLSGAVTITGTGRLNESGATTPLYLDGSRGVTIQAGGQLNAASGSTIELGGLLTNNGTQSGVLNVNLGGVVRGSGAFGTVNLADASTFAASGTVSGTLSVRAGAVVSLDGSGQTLVVAGPFVNNGTMRFTNGARLRVTSPANQVVNTGTIDVISGQLSLPVGFVNNGVVIDSSVVRVKQVSRPGGAVAVQIDGYPGHTYRLQRSTSLSATAFADVPGSDPQANPAGASNVVTLTFTDASPATGEGFYRVVVDA